MQTGQRQGGSPSASLDNILQDFPRVLQPLAVNKEPANSVQHQIITNLRLAMAKFHPIDVEKLATTKLDFQKMLVVGYPDKPWPDKPWTDKPWT
jgi:hypothetical protein